MQFDPNSVDQSFIVLRSMMTEDASDYLFCYTSKPTIKHLNKNHLNKNHSTTSLLPTQFTSLLTV